MFNLQWESISKERKEQIQSSIYVQATFIIYQAL